VKKICAIAFAILLLFPCFLSAKYMAVLETLSPKDLLTTQERLYLTDILRGQAVKMLPAEQNWTIMTRENINVMLPPGKKIEDCEGSCLAETGKNIAADYVAQARISQFGNSLAISAELYETATNKLISSFAGKGESVDDIEKIIKEQAPSFFKKARDNSWSGFGYVNTNSTFSFQVTQKFIVDLTTEPAGAIPTFDGKAIPQCTSTPCKIQLEAGEHRLVISRDRFEDLDTLINITENNQVINVNLVPNTGLINITPQAPENLINAGAFDITINGKKASFGLNELSPGIHSIRIEHQCFDPIELNLVLQKSDTKNFTDSLTRGLSGLELGVTKNGVPQALPIFFDGVQVSTTPFAGEVPLCTKIEIEYDSNRIEIPVELKWHEVTKTTYEINQKPAVTKKDEIEQKAEIAYAELDGKKPTAKPVKADSVPKATENRFKRLWGGIVAGLIYNDFYSTEFGLNSIPEGSSYKASADGADKLLKNFWGIGFKVGFSGMFFTSPYFNLRSDLNFALRQGTGTANTTVTLSWKDSDKADEKSDLKLEYSETQLNIDIPILARVTIPNSIYFEAGPMLSFNIYSNDKSTITDIYGSETYEESGKLSAFEFDIAAGIGVARNLGKSILDFDLRFVFGLTRLSDSKDSPKTWQGQLNVTYWFL